MKTKKRFGQHLLRYAEDAIKIAGFVPEGAGQILEIGPGAGALTAALLARHESAKITAVEFERDMVAHLRTRFASEPRCEIIQCDILDYDPGSLGAVLRVVGNLPYNISAPTLDWTVKHRNVISGAVYMLQREVADRLAGRPGGKSWSPLAIMTQLYFEIDVCFTLAPERFTPPPKVFSTVVLLSRRQGPELALPLLFKRTVRAAFANRRKLLTNYLMSGFRLSKTRAAEIIESLGFRLTSRAEELSTEQFIVLARALESERVSNSG